MANDQSKGMKSAYERALEQLDQQGIERPRKDSLTDAVREQMAEVRNKADAKLAELEILHRDRLARIGDPTQREEELANLRRDRLRIEEDRDRKLQRLRSGT